MRASTETVGLRCRNGGPGVERTIASSKDQPDPFWGSGHPSVAIWLIGNVPWCPCTRPQHLALIGPHRVHFGAGLCRTASSTGKGLRQTVRQGKACAIGAIDCRNKATEPCLAHVFSGVDLGQRLADHLRQKGHCPWVHALSHRCRRHRAGLLQWCHVCGQLGEGRVGLTPPPKVTQARKILPVIFAARGTKPVGRAAVSRGAVAKHSVSLGRVLRVCSAIDVSCAPCSDANPISSEHGRETSVVSAIPQVIP